MRRRGSSAPPPHAVSLDRHDRLGRLEDLDGNQLFFNYPNEPSMA